MAKIAWIDDDTYIIQPVVRPLELAGHDFIIFSTFAEVLADVNILKKVDLILLDLLIPTSDPDKTYKYPGLELLKLLRSEEYEVHTPVIVLSVTINNEIEPELDSLNVLDKIRKPVLPSVLKKRVEKALGIEETNGDKT